MNVFKKAVEHLKNDFSNTVKASKLKQVIEEGAAHIKETMGKRPKKSAVDYQKLSNSNNKHR